jgi:hypothetical protein
MTSMKQETTVRLRVVQAEWALPCLFVLCRLGLPITWAGWLYAHLFCRYEVS